jgi:hypothetical protein
MRNARKIPHVALANYNIIRGKNPNQLICVFEGADDLPYYETNFLRVASDVSFSPLIAKGKDQVLGLRELLSKRPSKDIKLRYFVDRDYDNLKEHPEGDDIYCTEGYSIENHIISNDALRRLLISEYKCGIDTDHEALATTEAEYNNRLEIFIEIMKPVNRAIFYARKESVRLACIEDKLSSYMHFDHDEIRPTENDIFTLIGWPAEISKDNISQHDVMFSQLDPTLQWRGKFIYGFFIKMLKLLKDDRTSDAPRYFSKKAGMKFDPNGELIRSLTSMSTIPGSLTEFILACRVMQPD